MFNALKQVYLLYSLYCNHSFSAPDTRTIYNHILDNQHIISDLSQDNWPSYIVKFTNGYCPWSEMKYHMDTGTRMPMMSQDEAERMVASRVPEKKCNKRNGR